MSRHSAWVPNFTDFIVMNLIQFSIVQAHQLSYHAKTSHGVEPEATFRVRSAGQDAPPTEKVNDHLMHNDKRDSLSRFIDRTS